MARAKSHLKLLEETLRGKLSKSKKFSYSVPSLWMPWNKKAGSLKVVKVNPYEYYLNAVRAIQKSKKQKIAAGRGGLWTRHAIIYNMFVRTTCAFDHNRNLKLDLPLNADGWRETGSFLKALSLLPYIQQMGVNTIHLLPITSIGSDGNKGTLGSPYAIKNPYELDPNLTEPNVGLGVEEEFKTFVEAAHHLGMRVVVEFVFRTSAKDGDWVKEHPDWMYWIRADVEDRQPGTMSEDEYGSPIFTREELEQIKGAAERNQFQETIPPHQTYRNMYTAPPQKETIRKENGRYIGMTSDGTKVRIPGAFADWPPDDSQPPWGDVTYLKMYEHTDFNYIAYNTIRIYDQRLAQMENVNIDLWQSITGIIPHYQETFGIDGVMIDMGHALPMDLKREMVRRAREINPDFAFWDENFSVNEKSLEEGYNAVIGYQWSDQHRPEKFRGMLNRFATEGFPIPYFATPESHNTPRAAARKGGARYSRYAWAVSNFLPAIPFIHSGFELGETYPINTGLDFTSDDLKRYPSEKLPLFSEGAYDWTNKSQFTDWIRAVGKVRAKYEKLITDPSPESFIVLDTGSDEVIAFVRRKKGARSGGLCIIANTDLERSHPFSFPLTSRKKSLTDLLLKRKYPIKKGYISGKLSPGEVSVMEI